MNEDILDYMATKGREPRFSSRGRVIGFRSRPGAPLSAGERMGGRGVPRDPNQSGMGPSTNSNWGVFFGSNSNYGSRPGAGGDPYGSAANPIRFTSSETDAITSRRAGINATNRPFMPSSEMKAPADMSPAQGDQWASDALSRNMAMTQPGGLAQFQSPRIGIPNDSTDSGLGGVSDEGLIPANIGVAPDPGWMTDQSAGNVRTFGGSRRNTAAIERKYGNKSRPGYIDLPY